MDINEVNKFSYHIGQGAEMKLKRKDGTIDVFKFEPLGVEFLPKVMQLSVIAESTKEEKELLEKVKQDYKARKITKSQLDNQVSEIENKAGMRLLEGDNAHLMVDLITEMVTKSYPDLEEDTRGKFIYMNMLKLYRIFFELNKDMNEESVKELSQVEELKSRGKS